MLNKNTKSITIQKWNCIDSKQLSGTLILNDFEIENSVQYHHEKCTACGSNDIIEEKRKSTKCVLKAQAQQSYGKTCTKLNENSLAKKLKTTTLIDCECLNAI